MTIALLDVPRCLNVDASYVGPPRALAMADGRPSPWTEALPHRGTIAYREQAVTECLDTVAVLRSYREPQEGETWQAPAASERRLLAQVNAIIALGPDALHRAIALSLDADVPDPGRVFAAAFALGCVEGRRWLDPLRRIFVDAAARNSAEAAAAIEALSLCPNAEVVSFLVSLVGDERSGIRASATRVLAFRGALSESQWNDAVADRDRAVVAAALSAPLHSYDPTACGGALQSVLERDADSETLTRLALRAGLTLNLDAAYVRAYEIVRTDPAWAGVARCLALVGDLSEARVREMLDGPHVLEGVRAAAILGSLDLVPDLLELLDRTDSPPETASASKHGLATITGLDFVSTESAGQALGLWSQHSSGFPSGARYRHGQPWSLDVLMQSLRTGPCARNIRQDVYFEMLVATRSHVPRFSAYDFVAVQLEALRQIERWLVDEPAKRRVSGN